MPPIYILVIFFSFTFVKLFIFDIYMQSKLTCKTAKSESCAHALLAYKISDVSNKYIDTSCVSPVSAPTLLVPTNRYYYILLTVTYILVPIRLIHQL